MNEMTILQKTFTKEGLGKIRIAKLNNEIVFNLYDTCFNLGYTKKNRLGKFYLRKDKIQNICESLDITGVSPSDTNKIIINTDTDFEDTWITEQSFYDLCLESHAKNARPFRRWVTGDVIPSIRKTGEYKLDDEQSFNPSEQSPVLNTMNVVKFIADDLRVSTSSRVKMYRQVCENEGINSNFLPEYTDEKAGRSATELLKKFNIPLTAVKFNKLMLEYGFLQEETRTSTNRQGFKKYKSLTERGLKYGKNQSSTHGSEKETQPLYYENTFMELINFLNSLKGVM